MLTDIETVLKIVNERNALRAEAGLPVLPVTQTARQIIYEDRWRTEDQLRRDFNARFRDRIYNRMIERERRRRADPTWTPSGSVFNGQPNFFYEWRERSDALLRRIFRGRIVEIKRNYTKLLSALDD